MLQTHTDSAVFAPPCTHSNCGTPSTIRQSLMNGTDGICFALTPETECIKEFNARLRTLFLNNLTFMCKKSICKECMERQDGCIFLVQVCRLFFSNNTVFCENESCRNHERNTWFLPKPLPSGKVTLIAGFREFGLQFALCSAIMEVL